MSGESLNALVWVNIERRLKAKHLTRKDLEREIPRNKNTYTNWFSDSRPMLRVNDLYDFGKLFGIAPAELLHTPGRQTGTLTQLDLMFATNSAIAKLEIESTGAGLILKPGRETPEG